MDYLRRFSTGIDRWTDRLGRATAWLTLAMVVVGSYNTVARYVDGYRGRHDAAGGEAFLRLSSNAFLELQWYLFSLVFLLGAAYALRHNAHVRVDLVYGRLGERGKAWIDLIGGLLLLLPFTIFGLWVSWPPVRNSWHVWEASADPGGLPRYPIKTVILVAFVVLLLQGLSETAKRIVVLWGSTDDEGPTAESSVSEITVSKVSVSKVSVSKVSVSKISVSEISEAAS